MERSRRFSAQLERRISEVAGRTGAEAKNVFLRLVSHREVNLILASIIVFSSLYVTFVSVLNRPFMHPLVYEEDNLTETYTVEEPSLISAGDQYVNSTMSVFILWLSALIIGSIFQFIKLPNLLGVLLTGIAYKNIPLFDGLLFIDERWNRFFRKAALTVILIRAGIGLDPEKLKRTKSAVFRLGIISTLCEAGAIVLTSHFIFGISLRMSILFGIILAATSPAVTIPAMLDLIKNGYGSSSGVPTALLASCTIDNMTCIAGYSVSVALIFTTVKITYEMAITFTTIVLSVVGGVVGGRVLWVFPHEGSHHVHFTRGVLLISVCLALNYGTLAIECPSAGVIATVILSMVASMRWRYDTPGKYKEAESLALMWNFFAMQIMFSLIGYEFDFRKIHTRTVFKAFAILGVGTVVRIIAVFLLSFGCGLRLAEQFFMSVSFLSKATLQAALAPQVVERSEGTSMHKEAVLVMATCVIGIIIMAPIGQVIIQLLGQIILSPKTVNKGRVFAQHKAQINGQNSVEHPAPTRQRSSVCSLGQIEEQDEVST
ncbi:Sodium/hydrogen exchanger 9B1 [Toxocara canis]|uniref:Sodium/hydrogen exchanger 9B1 n=1 Tax=Toxocara canis TaxID=6265 RepID=A0A0B2UTZ0_TOXCA|nr:Sodium/hydrogen exchanger 9B1 [Toxocara canis]